MNILILGGFLGSGKTTILRSLIQGLTQTGETCAIIENEIGEVGIDDALIGEANLEVKTLFGGCVCCTISGSLVSAIHQIKQEIAPNWVLIEMTGVAMLDSIREVFAAYDSSGLCVYTVSVVDVSRWDMLVGPLEMVFTRQVAGADVVLLNKIDVRVPTREMCESIRALCPDGAIVEVSDHSSDPRAFWNKLTRCFEKQG